MSGDSLLNSALKYADLGYAVFPCHPGQKTPLTEHGFKDASTDPATIETWWTQHPTANVAIATADLLVVDIDGQDNPLAPGRSRTSNSALRRRPFSITPRGGCHHWFRQPDGRAFRNTAGLLAPKVDTRSNGGYVLVPPSVVNGSAYQWVEGQALDIPRDKLPEPPAWLVDVLDPKEWLEVNLPPTIPEAAGAIPEGQRNRTLTSIGGAMRRIGLSKDEIEAALHRINVDRCRPYP